jgi:hypothetical protein
MSIGSQRQRLVGVLEVGGGRKPIIAEGCGPRNSMPESMGGRTLIRKALNLVQPGLGA